MATAEYRREFVERVPLVGGTDTGGGLGAWQNPHENAVIITGVWADITTAATAACTADIGTTATSVVTSSDNLIDGLDVNAASGVFDNNTDKGTNGKTRQRLASGKWITASRATGASAGLAGYLYIRYLLAA